MQGSQAGHVALADRPVTAENPCAALGVDRQLGEVVVKPVHVTRHRRIDVRDRLLPGNPVQHGHANHAVFVQQGGFDLEQESGVLAPVEAALVPCRPKTVVGIDGQRDVGFVQRRGGYRRWTGCPSLAVPRAEHNVVVPALVGVPGDVDLPVVPCRDHRLPVVGVRRGHALGAGPFPVHIPKREYVGLAVPETLPDHPQAAVGGSGHVGKDVGLGRLGEPHARGPSAAVQRSAVQVEVPVFLMRPDEPCRAVARAGHLDHVDVPRLFGDCLDRPPCAAVEFPRQDHVAAILVGDPGGPGAPLGPAKQRREVVFVLAG